VEETYTLSLPNNFNFFIVACIQETQLFSCVDFFIFDKTKSDLGKNKLLPCNSRGSRKTILEGGWSDAWADTGRCKAL
jgi:hypothetical protein